MHYKWLWNALQIKHTMEHFGLPLKHPSIFLELDVSFFFSYASSMSCKLQLQQLPLFYLISSYLHSFFKVLQTLLFLRSGSFFPNGSFFPYFFRREFSFQMFPFNFVVQPDTFHTCRLYFILFSTTVIKKSSSFFPNK